jgi:hypothetical protein
VTQATGRIAALDRVRTFTTLLVVIHHSVVNYTFFGNGDRIPARGRGKPSKLELTISRKYIRIFGNKFDFYQIRCIILAIPSHPKGRLAIVTKRGAGCDGRGSADNERR